MTDVSFSKKKAFTLIELLVVIAIIGILAAVVVVNLGSARAKARDARRKTDLEQVRKALEMYYDEHGTYAVKNTGYEDTGTGWLSYYDDYNYKKSISQGLYEEGLLSTPEVSDPKPSGGGDQGYMLYLCDGGQTYALYATLEGTETKNIDFNNTCGGEFILDNNPDKNYVITNNLIKK